MLLNLLSLTAFSIMIGFRHGMDSDHVAAIADMVGSEKQRGRQLKMGVTYALGHGAIVMVIGLIAIFWGARLPEHVLQMLEFMVGASLLVLGSYILYSIFIKKQQGYQSRFEIAYRLIAKLFKKDDSKLDLQKIGIFGAFLIGVLHGIGAETPTQVMLIANSVGLNNSITATLQIVLFTLGLLGATVMVTYLASWGFTKAKVMGRAYLLLGCLTGGYSVLLGFSIIQGI